MKIYSYVLRFDDSEISETVLSDCAEQCYIEESDEDEIEEVIC